MASDTEAEFGRLLEKFKKATSMRTTLSEMVHQQPSTPAAKENIRQIPL